MSDLAPLPQSDLASVAQGKLALTTVSDQAQNNLSDLAQSNPATSHSSGTYINLHVMSCSSDLHDNRPMA